MASRKDKYYLVSLGCSKNTVDSESMAQVLDKAGMRSVGDPRHAEVLARGRAVRCALAQHMCDETSLLSEGAEVAFFPPVTGG